MLKNKGQFIVFLVTYLTSWPPVYIHLLLNNHQRTCKGGLCSFSIVVLSSIATPGIWIVF